MLKKISNILFSYWTMLFAFVLLAGGAAVATFIENDYGTSTAKVVVYNHIWYEMALVLSVVNLAGIMIKRKMYKNINGRFIFHLSFVIMLIGSGMTRYIGYEGIMHIREGQTQNNMISLEPYFEVTIKYQGKTYYAKYQKEFSAISDNSFSFKIHFENRLAVVSLDSYKFAKKGSATMNLIGTKVAIGDETQVTKLVGQRGTQGLQRELKFKDNITVTISYGSKNMTLPFAIRLNDFQLDRYPGSMSPSSYASEVTLIDKQNNVKFDYRIFMNSTLKYGGYQFFQSSYDQDEKGTILSVNNDPGTIPTYIGYFLLTLGLLLNMFDKKSRFAKQLKYVKQFNSIILVVICGFILNTSAIAQDTQEKQFDTVKYLEKYKAGSLKIADNFGHLVTQSGMGRMKPLDSLNHEILNKLSRKSTLMGMNANQVILGMLSAPSIWQNVKMLKIKTPKLKKYLHLDKNRKYLAFNEIFSSDGKYVLKDLVSKANAMNPNKRGTFEKDILKLDERLNIAYMVYYGNLFKIFPKPYDNGNTKVKYRWYNPIDAINGFDKKTKQVIKIMISGLVNNVANLKFDKAQEYLDQIKLYQEKVGSAIIPSKSKIDNEILFNKLNIFFKLTIAYMILGFVLLIIAFAGVINKKLYSKKLNTFIFIILAALLVTQTFAMGHRWYISGHAPWSDTYESLVYIAWSTMFAGVVFFRKSLMALSATAVMAGVFMFTAHLTGIDPQITNLVPVLKSYWLTIHVSIITGSYGFLAIGAMLGFIALILFIFRGKNKEHIDNTIRQITAINEIGLIIGIAMLVVGNFIGGIWANESWGRYWGWDPKETWAYVSIIVYAIVLHLRFIKRFDTPFVFATASTLAFSSILMTYFGVNFYLSGMHSYATGDPVPIPTWVYGLAVVVFSVIVLAYRKRELKYKKLS
jgi:cytochrome c-type biogenesis protein CcsB